MKCKLCLQDKTPDMFDKGPSGKPISWCKECRTLCERALRQYTKWAPRSRDEWPDTLYEDVNHIKVYMERGGIPFRRAKVEAMLRHLDWEPEHRVDSVEVSADAFAYLMDRVEELERLIATRSAVGMGNHDELDAQARRFTDAVNKLDIPGLSKEDMAYYRSALRHMFTEVQGAGELSPSTMRELVAPLELASAAMPLELVRIYNAIIEPALQRTRTTDHYTTLAAEAEEMLGLNYYEVDWLEIPLGDLEEQGEF